MNTSDFTDNSLSGITTVRFGRAIFKKTLSSDIFTEGSETFYMNVRTGDNSGPIVHTTNLVFVNDTSVQSERLYSFDSFTFNNGSATGRSGPSLSSLLSSYNTSTYTWLNNVNYFDTVEGIQIWTVPKTGTYRITAAGGVGGEGRYATDVGGKGAIMQGDFNLSFGQKIKILVGHRGSTFGSPFTDGNGGGGTFVVRNTVGTPSTSDILVIAGGGGGNRESGGNVAGNGNAKISDPAGGGATGGNGGAAGGGFLTDGGTYTNIELAKSFLNGGLGGGFYGGISYEGSFGGGSASTNAFLEPGGGGGYSGGGSGGGGSSINNGTNQSNSVGNAGHGYVVITAL
jgi:hypothetical protein